MMVGLDVQSVMVIVLSETNFYICNCIYGHQNCQCDGKGNIENVKNVGSTSLISRVTYVTTVRRDNNANILTSSRLC